MMMMGYISYYLVGFAGIAVVLAGTVMTFMRIWDGVTDPIIGFVVDKTNGKFGKNRPFMVLGNVILAVMAIIIFKTTHLVPIIGLVCNLVAMKFYPLTKEKMEEIQEEIAKIKAKNHSAA